MAVLHVIEQGSRISLSAGRVRVSVDGVEVRDVPARKVSTVVVNGNVRVTTPALVFFCRSGVKVIFCSMGGDVHGVAGGLQCAPATRVEAQLSAAKDLIGLSIGREMIAAKLVNSTVMLQRLQRQGEDTGREMEVLGQLSRRLDLLDSIGAFRGVEGAAASAYFRALRTALRAFGFLGRSTRPPRDPVNAALSYGYGFLHSRVLLAVQVAGLHPEVGVVHAMTRRNHALVFDIMDEFRVVAVDTVVISAFRQGRLLAGAHFKDHGGGVHLSDEGKRALIPLLEERLTAEFVNQFGRSAKLTDVIQTSASLFAAAIEGRRDYIAFRLRR